MFKTNRFRLLLWSGILLCCALIISTRIWSGLVVETNILNLLPQEQQDTLVQLTTKHLSDELSKRVFFLLLNEDEDVLIEEAQILLKEIQENDIFESVRSGFTSKDENDWFQFFYPRRYTVLPESFRELLTQPDAPTRFLREYQEKLYSTAPDFYGKGLADDPLMLFSSLMMEQANSNNIAESIEGLLLFPGDTSAVLIATNLHGEPFNGSTQKNLEQFIKTMRSNIAQESTLSVTGITRYAEQGFRQGKWEASTIGTLSILGIVLLFLLVFRSVRALITGFLPIFAGMLMGTAALFATSGGTIHLISLSMGACLIGIVVDYSFHFLADAATAGKNWNSHDALRRIFPGITLGALTTIVGFSAFFFNELPGLRQIATLTVFGLFGAWLTVVLVFPIFLKKPLPQIQIPDYPQFVLPPLVKFLCVIIVIGLAIPGLCQLQTDDSITRLRNTAPELEREERQLIARTEGADANRFFVVVQESEEELLEELELFTPQLEQLKKNNVISGYRSVAQFVTSPRRAKENQEMLQKLLSADCALIPGELLKWGFSPEAVSKLQMAVQDSTLITSTVKQWLQDPVSDLYRSLWIDAGKLQLSIILLEGIQNEDALRALDNGATIHYENNVERISSLLGDYRRSASRVVIIAFAGVFLLLIIRYSKNHGILRGFMTLLPPILATIGTLSILGYLSIPLNLMHLLGQLLVLGIGIDYTIFMAESGKRFKETILAISLAAITTLFSFGTLSFSTTPALAAIGHVVVPGILLSLLFSPLAAIPVKKRK